MRRAAVLLALLAACGGGPPIPATDLLLRIDPGAFEVEPGEPFPLTVTRVWRKDLEPAAWDQKALAPLALRLEDETRRDDGTRVEETFRYVAHAFSLRDVVVRGVKLAAQPKDGGKERKVAATGFRIRVRPVLDPEDPGPPELPGEPPPSRGWIGWGSGALAAVLAAALLLALRRRPRAEAPPPAAPEPPPASPRERALGRLRGASVEEAADIVRAFVSETRRIRALEKTTEELLRELPRLLPVLRPADLAKFAAHEPTPAERDEVVAAASTFIREEPS
ncbi:MAG TPA: hypothetical protein VFY93_01860 [Planctomycetota bacterium]|nr:hypothetical protein [Planctomycetota bacterium]